MTEIKLKFYNSRTKQIDLFVHDKSIPINMYTCGPTVYDRVHLGNLKTFLWSDFVVEYLNAIGYKTNHIMNITDIDDKIIGRLPEQTYSSLIKYTSFYTDKFLEDIGKLGIRNYTKSNIHKVTDNVDSMEQMVLDLLDKGFAYETPDGSVYFDSTKIPESNPFYVKTDTEGYESSRNIIRAEGVRSPRDFVLWKVKTDRNLSFMFNGKPNFFPGWDSECCALCDKLLGKVHIKMGGSDLKSKHHANEVSQAESLHPDRIYGDYWIHFGFLNFGGDKMSKSLGNVLRLDDVVYNHYLIRMYLLTKSYKNDVDYIDDEILTLKKDFINFHMLYNKLSNKFYRSHKNEKLNYSGQIEIYTQILEIISNNLNVFDAIREFMKYVDKLMKVYLTSDYADKILDELDKVNNLFNILDKSLLSIDSDTMKLIGEREDLRKLKQFEKTDAIREQIKLTYIFEDENTGFTLIRKLN
jgi:cysteinyl-tRNA synthetase